MDINYYIKIISGIQRKNLAIIKSFYKLKAGKGVAFEKKVYISIRKKGTIQIGKRCVVETYGRLVSFGGEIVIGEYTGINRFADIVSHKKIKIGSHCAIGPRVIIYDHDHKFGKNGMETGIKSTEIVIGDNCWIGANVTILRGTHIGNNCVIGAGCVVKGDIPDNTLVTQDRELILTPLV